MVEEQIVAFTLMSLHDLITRMDGEELLCEDDYNLLKNAHNKILELNGFMDGKI